MSAPGTTAGVLPAGVSATDILDRSTGRSELNEAAKNADAAALAVQVEHMKAQLAKAEASANDLAVAQQQAAAADEQRRAIDYVRGEAQFKITQAMIRCGLVGLAAFAVVFAMRSPPRGAA